MRLTDNDMTKQSSPYATLVAIENSCRKAAAGLPSQEEKVESWRGIGFRIGEQHFVAPMSEVAEVLHEPRYTLLPGVKSWIKGVANVRGRLLPVVDLSEFLQSEPSANNKERRILVVEYQEVFAGLIVDAVLGMQHFALNSFSEQLIDVNSNLQAYAHGVFHREQAWMVFSPYALAKSGGFLDVVA